ncbi:YbgA family protein [Novispirillum sp. DQ9]|uniref:YbgA family protein n=1 Tax=Novispirillum sp. DQ9 TaxID=3398612 RepID=UPI003C7CE04F
MLNDEIKVGVSSCLLGQEVRFDSGHKRDRFVVDDLGRHVTFVPVCPEVGIGMSIPREAIRLVRHGHDIRLRGTRSDADHTEPMLAYAQAQADALAAQGICGYVFKKGSPSCGLFRVKVYAENGMPSHDGRGLYARVLAERLPDLPMEEEGRLFDPGLRENFVTRLFAYHRLKRLFAGAWTLGDLVAFHSAEKMLLLAHHPQTYEVLGRVVAQAKGRDRAELEAEYRATFLAGLTHLATPQRTTNVLQHMAGYFKDSLDADEKAELNGLIADYHGELVPLIAPITLLRHYVRKYKADYLANQTFLAPHPKELMLRNHV